MIPAHARRFIQRGKQVEGDVGRLIMRRVCSRDVVTQAAKRRFARERLRSLAAGLRYRVPRGYQAGCDGFNIPLDTRDLAREEYARMLPKLERRGEQRRRVDISIPVDLPIS